MADLHVDVTYKGWGKSSAAGHRECMGNSKRVLRRSISSLRRKTDRLHVLIVATQRVGVFISGKECVQKIMELFETLPIFVPTITKSLTAESNPEGTRKSTRIIAMNICKLY